MARDACASVNAKEGVGGKGREAKQASVHACVRLRVCACVHACALSICWTHLFTRSGRCDSMSSMGLFLVLA